MNATLHVQLNATPEQLARLQALQGAFAGLCNALAPIVQQTRCWNRVALHHLTYRLLRERFPLMGSQMICNAIYSVSRACRIVLQHPNSPWNITKQEGRPLPLLNFQPNCPVYFDRHTLSLKDGYLSMYTLDGRMRFQLGLKKEDETRFHNDKLREIVLAPNPEGFQLSFHFSPLEGAEEETPQPSESSGELPEYLVIVPGPVVAPALHPVLPQQTLAPGVGLISPITLS
jgi:hypothetical protein